MNIPFLIIYLFVTIICIFFYSMAFILGTNTVKTIFFVLNNLDWPDILSMLYNMWPILLNEWTNMVRQWCFCEICTSNHHSTEKNWEPAVEHWRFNFNWNLDLILVFGIDGLHIQCDPVVLLWAAFLVFRPWVGSPLRIQIHWVIIEFVRLFHLKLK